MREITLNVPRGIQYISEWKEYNLPYRKCIVDKGVTGCGYTEFCLNNSENVILCSPRKLLLENKRDQHIGDPNICYIENKPIEIKRKINPLLTIEQQRILDEQEYKKAEQEKLVSINKKIFSHIQSCLFNKLPIKFMITYDSSFYLLNYLENNNLLGNFKIVVDEFQEIFLDAYFKASLENDFIENLSICPNVIYLSATPMLTKYLKMIDEFRDLDYYILDWSNSGYVEKIKILRSNSRSLVGSCSNIIQDYLQGKYPTVLNPYTGKVSVSKEAVFYLNDVSDIIKIINKNGLVDSQVNILCSDSKDNVKKLRKIHHSIGKIPLENEPNKMFTFCTKSVFVGADFYSDNAKTFLFCDPNLKCLALDISLDLPQIAGRQRNRLNPFKNTITMYYRNLRTSNIHDRDSYLRTKEYKKDNSGIILRGFEKLEQREKDIYTQKLESAIYHEMYCNDFISVSRKTGKPVYNKFIEIADERAWEVSQLDYQDEISLTKALETVGYDNLTTSDIEKKFKDELVSSNLFSGKLKVYCEFCDKYPELINRFSIIAENPKFLGYYKFYGTKGCKAKEFMEKYLEEGFRNSSKESELEILIRKEFISGYKYTLKDVKSKVKEIYDSLNITEAPKATILSRFLNIKETTLYDKTTKKRNGGIEIL